MLKTYKISITGQVQGVGFRPYVFGLAKEYKLNGSVSNNVEGVIIYVNGLEENVSAFHNKLITFPPPVSRIKNSDLCEVASMAFDTFRIIPSDTKGQLNLSLTPDFAICEDCKNDIQNPANRRYNYPFTTCVNCGPRWAITETFPFERDHTSIDAFPMCNECLDEYTSPSDRRFHSQTNTCKTCGIKLYLVDNKSEKINTSEQGIFKQVANYLKEGNIVAIKNTSGYLLCCNAENKKVIQELRRKKNRPNKPFAVLYPSIDFLEKEVELNDFHRKTLASTERPITIIPLQNYKGNIDLDGVAPGLHQLGVMVPYSGILQLLIDKLDFPIVATSGNIHGSPIISKREEAIDKLKNVADYFLQHNLKVAHPQDDSVVKFSVKFNKEILFRRSRGYSPNYFNSNINSDKKIMAMGAHLKSTITFYPNTNLYVSEYLGNLDNYDVYQRFTKTGKYFIKIFEQRPEVILVDKHPSYHSTQYGNEVAKNNGAELIEIQHHKAHFTAVLGEHNLFNKKVLGVVFDGTGYGDDEAIWGGEFFNYESNNITRIDHLDYFDWLLGDKMSKEPRLSLLSLSNEDQLPILEGKFTQNELKTYQSLKATNTLKTSSVGRLFDAVASLLNITDYNTYEGEAAILFENQVDDYELTSCKSYLTSIEGSISPKEIIAKIHLDIKNGVQKKQIIINFLYTLASSIIQLAKAKNYSHVAVSGGVFQNTILVDMLLELAPKEIKLYFHEELSPNDENISFGQLMHYLHIKTKQ